METTLQPHSPAGSTDDLAQGSGRASPHRTWLSLAVSEGSRWLVVAFTVTLLLIINYEVFARYLFNAPTVWVTEYSTYLVAAMAFLGAAFAVVRDSHTASRCCWTRCPAPGADGWTSCRRPRRCW